MKISIIVALAEKNAIGKDNKLLCHLPADLKYFKEKTSGKTVVMGRNTFLSLPKGALPNRKNIVISDNQSDNFKDCIMASSIEEAIRKMDLNGENFIIGGASIYSQFLPFAQKLYITQIHHCFDADAFFPSIDHDIWQLAECTTHNPDEKNKYAYSFTLYTKK